MMEAIKAKHGKAHGQLSLFTMIALALVLLATWLRLWRLNSVPPGFWFDEGFNAMEAVWMLKTNTWPVFILGGQGREVMFHYLLAVSISVLGETIYAVRLVPALLGIVSIPLMYRWVLTLFKEDPMVRWVALIGTAGLAVSFWYLVMNRIGYRANTLLPMMLLTVYFFWRGWQTRKLWPYVLAGLGLGLCQYTYLAGRLVPLVFIVFVSAMILSNWNGARAQLKTFWPGLLIMAGVAALVTLPMLLFFVDYPELFWERGGDVAFEMSWTFDSLPGLARQLVAAGRVFIDGQDPNWRHHLLGRPGFNWLSILNFWIGLAVIIKQYRKPRNLFLLSMLVVMWLPAILSEPSFHTLRLVGILPAYYTIVAVGLLSITHWLRARLPILADAWRAGFTALVALLLFSGGITFYDYFFRWANLPQVYQSFDGEVVSLAQKLVSLDKVDVVIPYYLYTHASMRYILNSHFQEAVILPEAAMTDRLQQNEVTVVIPEYPEDDGEPPAFVWLTKDEAGLGMAYVSAVARGETLSAWQLKAVNPLEDKRGNIIAHQYQVKGKVFKPYFLQSPPRKQITAMWADNLALTGYEFIPPIIEAGDTSNLYLSWEILGYTGLEEKIFLQVLDSQGNPVGQSDLEPISRKMYRWRDDGLIFEQYPLKFKTNLTAGLYFVRLGFFDTNTNQRLTVHNSNREPLGDALIVGPLYLSARDVNPISPQHPLQATLGSEFELLGYSIYPSETENSTAVELFWKTHAPVDINYTVFVQLLDQQNQVIAQVDAQPLQNLYPTSRWQAGDVLSDRFVLPVAFNELYQSGRLVTGMYDLSTGVRLPAYNDQGDLLPDGMVRLE